MNSIQELFVNPNLQGVTRLAVFRCKREFESYDRNRKNLPLGRTDWWSLDENQDFGGVVILLDSMDNKFIEVWVGRSSQPNSGRLPQKNAAGKVALKVDEEFLCVGVILHRGVRSFVGQNIGNTVTYVERTGASHLPSPVPASSGHRRFNKEFSGDRNVVRPGSYTPNSLHGKAITALHDWLSAQAYTDLDNAGGGWDMHGFGHDGTPHLFELKTGANTTNVYTAVGQLLLYELVAGNSRKVMVLPHSPQATQWKSNLDQLEISLITFSQAADGFAFTQH